MKVMNKVCKSLIALVLCLTSVFSLSINLSAEEVSNNLALNKPVVASAEYSTMPASNLTDADEDSRWSTERDATQWAYVDLGQEYEMNKFQMIWESDSVYAQEYNIYVSNDINDWGSAVVVRTENNSKTSEDLLAQAVSGRYVKLEVTKVKGYPSVSCRDFKVLNTDEKYQDPTQNVALNKTAVASSIEADSVRAANATDGDTTSRSSRWGSNLGDGPDWIYVDLGEKLNVNVVKIFWENRKATSYKLQIAEELSDPMSEDDWTTVKEFNDRPASIDEKIVLDQVYKARYVRLLIDSHTSADPDGGVAWNTVSIYEIEVYGGNPDIKPAIGEVLNAITVDTPEKGDKKLSVNLPEVEGYKVEYNGTDFEQVIDDDLTIYQPVVDKEVSVSFKVTDEETNDYKFKEIKITVPGKYEVENSDNEAPNILPELAEWKGEEGSFVVSSNSRIVIAGDELQDVADALAADYKEMTGKKLTVVKGSKSDVQSGDFYFALTDDTSKGLQDEGYLMTTDEYVEVEAETTTGAYWATRTILQSLKQTNDIPCGITRDYPLYEVRGFILDVGRKTFTLDYLKQVVKQMSWYKMNDFQVHLNDNLIGLENVADPMSAYSAFRLESDVKAGGNNGLNQADLTSTDMFYTKDEFRDFIKESRIYGVDIVPEIDTPAHSLALTKVRPDLRHGTNGRNNDHLALRDKYDECIEFVKDIFNEYMTDDNPVFDDQTIVHVGADEYNADKEAYRKFSDDMLGFVQDTGRTARIWGSLSQCRGTTPVRSEGVQMNLWNFGYANMDEMYEQGYDLINCNDGNYYVVPNAGYYYDYLNDNTLYNLDINTIGGVTIPAGDKQMIGGAFAVWNDMTDYLENGVSEYDVYDRIENAIPLFGAKLWGKGTKSLNEANTTRATLGDAPGTNFGYDVDSKDGIIANYPMNSLVENSENNRDLTAGNNASIASVDGKKALKLNGSESYVNSPVATAGLGNDLRVKVKRTSSSSEEQVLFESSYGTIKAVQKDTGKVGFSRENHDYSFDYELPINEWVELEFKNEHNVTSLYVNGKLVDVLGDGEKVEGRPLLATTMFPIERIGSKTNAFIGYVDDVRIGENKTFNSTMNLDYAVLTANALLKEEDNVELETLVNQAKVIFELYDPSSEEVESLTTQINAIIKTIDYAKADYSRVNKYLNLVLDDLSVFTDASVARLQNVIDSIREDLPASMQETVDGYVIQLANALANLELKAQLNVNYVDNSKLTATASSYQRDGSNPSNVLDNDTGTMWHTDWSITTMPHWIALEIDEPTAINGLSYTPRQTGTNGNLTEYRIEISDDGENWNTIKTGTLSSNSSTKVIDFDTVTTKFVRLVYVKAVNNNGSASEIKLHRADVPADVDGLNTLIEKAESIKNTGYSEESWTALQNQILVAKELTNSQNPDANEIEITKRNLIEKMVKLVLTEEVKDVSKTKLQIAVDLASNVTEEQLDKVVPAVVTEFNAALEEARVILANDNATQEEVDASFARLATAMHMLEFLKGDKTELQDLVDSTADLVAGNYTEESWSALQEALVEANAVLDDVNAMQEEVDDTCSNLQAAIDGLVEVKQVDKSLLEAMVNRVLGLEEDKYVPATWQAMLPKLEAAQEVLADDNATQAEVDKAWNDLTRAYLNLRLKPIIVQKGELQDLVDSTADLVEEKYTEESWSALQDALDKANAVLANDNATQEEVDEAYDNLQAAINGLEEAEVVDKSSLEAVVNRVLGLEEDKYIPSTWSAMLPVLETAQEVLANNNATQAEVDKAYDDLVKAYLDLRVKPNKDELQDLVDSTADLVEGNYTEESWSALQDALAEANAVLLNEEATQEEVDEAYDNLQAAINGLEEAEVVDKSLLEAMVNKVLGLEEDKYIASSWQAMLPELEAAQEVLGNEKATQAEVDEACDALTRAYLNLRLKPNKDLLSDLINKANGLNSASYTANTWAVVENEVIKAQAVLEDPEASEAEVKAAEKALTKALEGLEPVKAGDTTVSVKTGDTTNMMYPLLGLAIASLGFYGNKKRKGL